MSDTYAMRQLPPWLEAALRSAGLTSLPYPNMPSSRPITCRATMSTSTRPRPSPPYQLQQKIYHQHQTQAKSTIPATTEDIPSAPDPGQVHHTSYNRRYTISTRPRPSPPYQLQQKIYHQHQIQGMSTIPATTEDIPSAPDPGQVHHTSYNRRNTISTRSRACPPYQLQQKIYHQHQTQAKSTIPAATEDIPSAPDPGHVHHTSYNRRYTISTRPRPSPPYQLQQKIYHQHQTQGKSTIPATTEDIPSAPDPGQVHHISCNRGYTISTRPRPSPPYQLQQKIYHKHQAQGKSTIPVATEDIPSAPDPGQVHHTSCNRRYTISTRPRPSPPYQLQQKIYHQHQAQGKSTIPVATEDIPSAPDPGQVHHTSCNRRYTISTRPRACPPYQLQQKIYHQHQTQGKSTIPAATEDIPSTPGTGQVHHTSCNRGYTINTRHKASPPYQLQQKIYHQHQTQGKSTITATIEYIP